MTILPAHQSTDSGPIGVPAPAEPQTAPTAFEPVRRWYVVNNEGYRSLFDEAGLAERTRAHFNRIMPDRAPHTILETTELPTAELQRLREELAQANANELRELNARIVAEDALHRATTDNARLREIERALHSAGIDPCYDDEPATWTYTNENDAVGFDSLDEIIDYLVKARTRTALARTTDAGTVEDEFICACGGVMVDKQTHLHCPVCDENTMTPAHADALAKKRTDAARTEAQ